MTNVTVAQNEIDINTVTEIARNGNQFIVRTETEANVTVTKSLTVKKASDMKGKFVSVAGEVKTFETATRKAIVNNFKVTKAFAMNLKERMDEMSVRFNHSDYGTDKWSLEVA